MYQDACCAASGRVRASSAGQSRLRASERFDRPVESRRHHLPRGDRAPAVPVVRRTTEQGGHVRTLLQCSPLSIASNHTTNRRCSVRSKRYLFLTRSCHFKLFLIFFVFPGRFFFHFPFFFSKLLFFCTRICATKYRLYPSQIRLALDLLALEGCISLIIQ